MISIIDARFIFGVFIGGGLIILGTIGAALFAYKVLFKDKPKKE